MKRKLFFAFSALLDEMELDPKELSKSIAPAIASAKKPSKDKTANPAASEAALSVIYFVLTKVHKAKTTYIPFVMEMYECTEEEAEGKDVEDVLKNAFTNGDIRSFFI